MELGEEPSKIEKGTLKDRHIRQGDYGRKVRSTVGQVEQFLFSWSPDCRADIFFFLLSMIIFFVNVA